MEREQCSPPEQMTCAALTDAVEAEAIMKVDVVVEAEAAKGEALALRLLRLTPALTASRSRRSLSHAGAVEKKVTD
jgi:hypothetical protein